MRAEETVSMSHATLGTAITGIAGLIEDPVTALITTKGHSGLIQNGQSTTVRVARTCEQDARRKLNCKEIKARLFRKIKEVITSGRKAKEMMKAMLESQDFVAPVATIFKKKKQKGRSCRVKDGRSTLKSSRGQQQYRCMVRSVRQLTFD